MRFSPDGHHLLGGRQSAGIFIDGKRVAENAGNWGWVENDEVMGPGGYNGPESGLYTYTLNNGVHFTGNSQLATEFFGNGEGRWVLYFASNPPYSLDSAGARWSDRVALDFIGDYQVLTDQSYQPLIFRHAVTGVEQRITLPREWEQLPDGSGWFSRVYRGCYVGLTFYACGYIEKYGGMCLWRPLEPGTPTFLISQALDFNPDIAVRESDGLLVIGSGINQGETGQNLYIVDLAQRRFNKNGGVWQLLTAATEPTPPQPQPPNPTPIPPQPQPPHPQPPLEKPIMVLIDETLIKENQPLPPAGKMGPYTLVPVSGGVAIRRSNGCYVTVTPQGSIEQRPSNGIPDPNYKPGAWETFRVAGGFLVSENEGHIYAFRCIGA